MAIGFKMVFPLDPKKKRQYYMNDVEILCYRYIRGDFRVFDGGSTDVYMKIGLVVENTSDIEKNVWFYDELKELGCEWIEKL